ncbi:MAG: SpoVR family protein [Deltaproteobacteria bacterium]|nr:SpoVR family protein [Deltaproteobacteria bacterium]
MALPYELRKKQDQIEDWARQYGLDPFETIFEMVDYRRMNEVASYGGFPVRYPHWRFGMDFERMFKSHTYGLSMIYELVINNDPSYAYLLEGNAMVIQKLVMAHVMGHSDFFKNNAFFEPTNRKMLDEMANHATRVRRYMEQYGVDRVESFIDTCLSLENLIDIHAPYRKSNTEAMSDSTEKQRAASGDDVPHAESSMRPYVASFIADTQRAKQRKSSKHPTENMAELTKIPPKSRRDVLTFLLEQAPLAEWERNILEIVRDEAYYFAPQGMTKIMNEGWAVYWHSTIMTERAMTDAEVVDYAQVTAGVTATSGAQLNPYAIGVALFRDIEDRWNKGRFGRQWDECQDISIRSNWDIKLGLGREKIFEVRRFYNDITFIDEFFTEDFCRRHRFFNFSYNSNHERWEIESREFPKIKNRLLSMLTNFGQPRIVVEDANWRNRGELLLKHLFDGEELKLDEAQATLENLHRVWTRPVHIMTIREDKPITLSYDGATHEEKART